MEEREENKKHRERVGQYTVRKCILCVEYQNSHQKNNNAN
jgi:hypothetical protein